MEAAEDIVLKRKRDEILVHLINSDIDTQEKHLIKNKETKELDWLMKTERENPAEIIEDVMIDSVGINRKQDPLENEGRNEFIKKIDDSKDNDGCIMMESMDLQVEKNEEPGNDPLEDGGGGCRLENERCLVKLEDRNVYHLEGRALSLWMNEVQVLNFENNSGQVLESDGVVTYLGESERDITERERDLTESEKDIMEREHMVVNCQWNEKGGQGVLKSKGTGNKSPSNKWQSPGVHKYQCMDCGSYNMSLKSLARHRRRQNCALVKSVCEHCGNTFIRKDFKLHLVICATKEKYKCQKCSEKFTSQFSLLEHYETHTGKDTSTVEEVVQSNGQIDSSSDKHDKSISSEDSTSLKHNLNFKISSRSGTSNVQRESSNNRFSDPSRLLVLQKDQVSKHIEMLKHFTYRQAKNKRRLDSIYAGESPNKIPKCPENIESEENKELYECVRLKFRQAVYPSSQIDKIVKCPKEIDLEKNIMPHEFVSTCKVVSFGCQLCSIVFTTPMALNAHELDFHCTGKYNQLKGRNRIYKLKCQLCGEQCLSNLELYNHSQLHSDKQKYEKSKTKYECWMCLKGFSCKMALRRHSNKGNKPVKCSVCNKSFWKTCSLSQHMNTHNTNSVTLQ